MKIIEPHLKRKLLDSNHTLDHLFQCKTFNFLNVKQNSVSDAPELVVYCTDLQELIDSTIKSRNINKEHLKFGIDGGGGF